jgi:hypothetical protein
MSRTPSRITLNQGVGTCRETQRAERQDACWFRWLKFIALIVVPAGILGLIFFYGFYFLGGGTGSYYLIKQDTIGFMKFRFWLGASIGGYVGTSYMVRCIVRKADP